MTVSEIAHEYEWNRPTQKTDYAGGMTQGEVDELAHDIAERKRLH